jgi:hypothetical protein
MVIGGVPILNSAIIKKKLNNILKNYRRNFKRSPIKKAYYNKSLRGFFTRFLTFVVLFSVSPKIDKT